MPEWPEIKNLSKQMKNEMVGREITGIKVSEPKCLNRPLPEFQLAVTGRTIVDVTSVGKWIFLHLDVGKIAVNLNMGADVLIKNEGDDTANYRVLLELSDQRRLFIRYWFLGYFHYIAPGETHTMTDKLGPDIMQLTPERFLEMFSKRRTTVKNLLTDQRMVAGIGNYYIHDILFLANIHPLVIAKDISRLRLRLLYASGLKILSDAVKQRGADYELDLYGQPGGYSTRYVAYREGQSCPKCGSTIQKIKTGNTSSYVCLECQPY